MIEEYTKNEEEAIQELQSGVMQEEEQDRPEVRTEIEQPFNEGRKRKSNVEETEQGQEEEVSEFV